jgi:hypothetical protein
MDGELILDPSFFKLPTDYQYFIVCHEAGHIAMQSKSEQDADNYGFYLYIQSGRSLKALVGALADVLTFTTPEHLQRTKQMLARCANYDLIKNKNKMVQSISYSPDSNSLFGWTPLKNLQTRFDNKQERKLIKTESKAEARTTKADAKLTRAQTGAPGVGEQITNALGALGAGAANLMGKSATESAPEPSFFEKNKTAIIVTVVVVVVAVVAFVFLRRKK